ncbi:hypothetical protein P168DRAFT_268128 [Aspergillus campestris IBT 28561]|uniref:DUF7580 domain-containing protein n=1 Tax=Aspergillus campestris (strain IBT 28561) TaxID=1392248 RepID=A0A2I1D5H9_ASPC2|nr:uncharacterized protein P168DRAFT_268128 [Aspergillus campestris IBT 28561]PKY05129.1 hypothetical protein P168DRAFT_268128 [Aspergillus campestris IBT 28561]
MATGIEVASLALAILPLLVNQLEGYIRGIEKIKLLKRYRRVFANYSTKLGAQHAILLNTLEQVLKDVVEDNDKVSRLISDPRGEDWKDSSLQEKLRNKLGRSYGPFVGTMSDLLRLLDELSERLGIDKAHTKENCPTGTRKAWRVKILIMGPLYDDLLAKIDDANTILKSLAEPSNIRERAQESRRPWDELFHKYKTARNHTCELFKGIVGGSFWKCSCKEHHVVHFQLQSNPLKFAVGDADTHAFARFRMIFSQEESTQSSQPWNWREVEWEPIETVPSITLTQDLCSSLSVSIADNVKRCAIGYFPTGLDETGWYALYAVTCLKERQPRQSLRQALCQISRRDRMRIAAGLACGVMQLCGSWLKPRWNTSDIGLARDDEDRIFLDSLFFSWPLHGSAGSEKSNLLHDSTVRTDVLVPLGRTLVELSLGKSIGTLGMLDGIGEDEDVTKIGTALKLIEMVSHESGSNYAHVVHKCLLGSGISICQEDINFQEHVFGGIISPLLRDIAYFEGIDS